VLGLTWSLFLIKCLNLSGFSQVSSGNGHQFNTCYDEIEVCAHVISFISSSIITQLGRLMQLCLASSFPFSFEFRIHIHFHLIDL
jgi:hypothetical protein